MEIHFLGSGTSTGVPQIGCNCNVCISTDPKDKRLRASVLIIDGDNQVLIDAGPDLRQQLLKNKINKLSAILLTHEHYDHIGGLDDVRPLGKTQIYAEKKVLDVVQRNMPYCFNDIKYPGVPSIELNTISINSFSVNSIEILPIRVMHANLPIIGFRIGKFAYFSDIKTMDEAAINQLKSLDILIINALRQSDHISHLNLNEAINLAMKIKAKNTYFTHISHDMGLHDIIEKKLPESIHLAFDGLKLSL